MFSLFYHDIIYNTLRTDNEERSAELAVKRLNQIAAPPDLIKHCKTQILATKKHSVDSNCDTNFFTDADLSVLGFNWDRYSEYFKKIRKEYSFYPDLIYNPGRKKVLKHFLAMERIFKTESFFGKFEMQARENLKQELNML